MVLARSADADSLELAQLSAHGGLTRGVRHDAAAVLIVYLVLLSLVPPLLVLPGLGGAGRPAAVMGLLMLGWWLLTRLLPADGPPQFVAIKWTLYVRLMVFGVSMVLAIDRGLPGIESRQMGRAVLLILGATGIILTAIDGLLTRKSVERVLSWAVALGAVGAVVGILQFAFRFDLVSYISIPGLVKNREDSGIGTRGAPNFARVKGFARHPIEFGVVLATLLPISLHLASMSRPRQRVRWIVACVLTAAIPLSISRSAMLALVVGMAIYALGWTWRQRAHYAVLAVAAAFAFQAVVPGLLGTIRSLFKRITTDDSITGRTEDFGATATFIAERPWFGRGPGTFVLEEYRVLDNEYLGTLLQTGWVGLGSLILMLGCSGLTAIWLVRNSESEVVRSLSRALGAAIAVAFVVFGTFDALSFPIYSGLLFLIIGCIGALYRLEKVGAREPDPEGESAGLRGSELTVGDGN